LGLANGSGTAPKRQQHSGEGHQQWQRGTKRQRHQGEGRQQRQIARDRTQPQLVFTQSLWLAYGRYCQSLGSAGMVAAHD